MTFVADSYTLIAVVVAAGIFVLGIILVYYRTLQRNPASIGLIVTAALWVGGMGLTHLRGEALWELIGFYVQYCAISLLVPFLVASSIRFTRRPFAFRRSLILGLSVIGVFFALTVIASDALGWVFHDVRVNAAGILERQRGHLYIAYILYLLLGVFGGMLILLRYMNGLAIRDIRRSRILIFAYLIPTLTAFSELAGFHPLGDISLIPFSMVISVFLLAGGVANSRSFSPVVTAHESLVDAMVDPIVVVDTHGRVVYGNLAVKALFEADAFHIGGELSELLPELASAKAGDSPEDFVVRIGQSTFSVHLVPIDSPRLVDTPVSARLYVLHDVTSMMTARSELETQVLERTKRLEEEIQRYRQAKLELEQTVIEKEVLLQELHHRVKNNLQVIISLLNLQASRLDEGESLSSIFLSLKSRIHSISLVHERMHQTRFKDGVDFGEYVVELLRGIAALYEQVPAKLNLDIPVGKYRASMDFCVDFGLVVNELVTNTFKHGLAANGTGNLRVTIENDANILRLSVQDDGPGFPDAGFGDTRSLGMNIVNLLCHKHHATVSVSNNQGGRVEIAIPLGSEGITDFSLESQ